MTATQEWLKNTIIGLDLCPFASGPERRGGVRIATCNATDFDDCAREFLTEIEYLLEHSEAETTLIEYPAALADFEELLDLAATAEYLLEEGGLRDTFQVVSFHPDYVFEAAEEDDPANFTNRSPHPMLHIIREADVTKAVDSHPDPEGIPERNIELLRGLDIAEIRRLWALD